MNYTEDEVVEKFHRPILATMVYVFLSFALHMLFSSMVHNSSPKYFLLVAFYVGFAYHFLIAPSEVFVFWFLTICLFMVFLFAAMIINRFLGWSSYYVVKFLVVVNTVNCFTPYVDKPNVEDFVLTYVILAVKILSAADFLRSKGNEFLKLFAAMSYMTFAPWLPFRNFLFLTENRSTLLKDFDWWYMIVTTWSKVFTFQFISHNVIDETAIPDCLIKRQLLLIVQSFQYRCKYYFLTQISELQLLLVAGVQKLSWKEPYICIPLQAELSISDMAYLRELNKPASMFFIFRARRSKLVGEQLTLFIDVILILIIMRLYDVEYAYLCTLFVVSMYLEQFALAMLEIDFGVCIFTCPYVTCDHCIHLNLRNMCSYFYFKTLLCIYNKYCISLLFVRGAAIAFSVQSIWYVIVLNAMALAFSFVFGVLY